MKNKFAQKGFTLVELLIVTTMVGLIASFSLALFLNLNNGRNKQKAADDLVATLNQARSYSLSQVTKCAGTLESYEVTTRDPSATCYTLKVNCTAPVSSATLYENCLSGNITFGSRTVFEFPISGGTVVSPASVRLNGIGGSYITVSVDSAGIITAQ